MPKLKTHKGVKRRVKVTGTGKLLHAQSGRRHLLTRRRANTMRRLRRAAPIPSVSEKKTRSLIPYE